MTTPTTTEKPDDVCRVPETINFPNEEEKIQTFWLDNKVFETSLKQSKDKPRYTFYDGPPFATGLPHYGHILAGTIKDVVTRYAHQQGYHVDRRFGWDCHGLPVEFEIDKALNIRGPEDVAKMGIAAYNAECRKIVMRYADEWERIITRMGRWIDFKNDYKSLYPYYMETIWWIFQQLYTKGLVYQGVKVMPYSTACTTSLSNFESGQNYKEVVDPSVVVAFPIKNYKDNAQMLAWTTTPWTLPSNLALCVHPTMIYVKIRDLDTQNLYILAECRLVHIFKDPVKYEILEKFTGKTLEGLTYEPIFNYFVEECKKLNAHRILCDEYVTEESGTGVVHQAPYFGEEDYNITLKNGVIRKDSEVICPVDASGRFTDPVSDFKGQFVKDADKQIIAMLKKNGRLIQSGQVKHSYPFCWRSDTPLLYKAVPSWFIRVEQMSGALLKSNSQTYWVPDFVKEKRFGNWLRDARDWAISRNRYWGTPIPIWISDDRLEVVCIGSIEELQQYTDKKIVDIHRESIDDIVIPSKRPGYPPLRRIAEVFDCWFESGSMPLAQMHYPFENSADFDARFPADFIAEGIDQTRGWFYTLLVLSTALFNKPSFKNVIANGLILAADGQKMSKRKKNYPDPMEVVNKYGADALRLYLINSPVVRAENLRFKEDGVRDVIKDVFLPWYNAYRFLFQNIDRLAKEDKYQYQFERTRFMKNRDTNVMDIWITSFKESLLEFVAQEMKAYRLYTVVPRLTKFIDQLTNWYVRLNRRRIKGDFGQEQCLASLDTLFDILDTMVKMMAPFTPHLSEFMYQRLVKLNPQPNSGSVHYQMMPVGYQPFMRTDVEVAVSRMQNVIELGRVLRDRNTMPTKYPVPEVVIIHKTEQYLKDILSLQEFVLGELNVRKLTVCDDKLKYGVKMRAEPDHKLLGFRLKTVFKAVMAAIKALTDSEIQTGLEQGYFDIIGNRVELEEVRVIYCLDGEETGGGDGGGGNGIGGKKYEAHSDNDVLVLMDLTPGEDLLEEGIAREIINRVQKLKKKAQLIPTDQVLVTYSVSGTTNKNNIVEKVAKSHLDLIQTTIKSQFILYDVSKITKKPLVIEESFDLKEVQLKIAIYLQKELQLPVGGWVNLLWISDAAGLVQAKGTISLENYLGKEIKTFDELNKEIDILFRLGGRKFILKSNGKLINSINEINQQNVYVIADNTATVAAAAEAATGTDKNAVEKLPFCKFVNAEHDGRRSTIWLENPQGNSFFVDTNEKDKFIKTNLKRLYSQLKDTSVVKLEY